MEPEVDVLRLRSWTHSVNRLSDDIADVEQMTFNDHLPCRDSAHIKQLVNQTFLHLRGAQDGSKSLTHHGSLWSLGDQEFRPTQNRGERRSQFVREHGEEPILKAIRLLRVTSGVPFCSQHLKLVDLKVLADRDVLNEDRARVGSFRK